ncbi:MAG: YtxH domain-containing protein [bacterium]
MSNHGNDSEFFKGFLFGGLVGAVIALLYAPKSGKEMREDIRKMSADIKDDPEGKLKLAQEKAASLFEETKNQLEALRKDAEAALGEMKGKVAEGVDKSKTTLKNEKGRLSDAIDAGVSAYKKEKATKRKKKS